MTAEISQPFVIGVLGIQGDFQAHRVVLDRLGVPSLLVKKAADLDTLSGLILPGGESTTLLKIIKEEGLWEPLRSFAQSHPVFGTCAGAILMANEVEDPSQPCLQLIHMKVRRNAYGRQIYSFIRHAEAEAEFPPGADAEAPLEAVMIRAPIILETGPEVKVLARLDGKPILVREGSWLAATFHPELTPDTRIHRYFCRMVTPDGGNQGGRKSAQSGRDTRNPL